MKLQLLMARILRFLGDVTQTDSGLDIDIKTDDYYKKVLEPVIKVIDAIMLPLIILVGLGGSIYAIVLGVQMSRAESSDKKDEVKKRLINGVIGIVVMLILLILMKLLSANAEAIAKWVVDQKA